METSMKHKKYLGDGAYVSFEGYHVVLTTENGDSVTNKIFLDPFVYRKLVEYVAKMTGETSEEPERGE